MELVSWADFFFFVLMEKLTIEWPFQNKMSEFYLNYHITMYILLPMQWNLFLIFATFYSDVSCQVGIADVNQLVK